MSTIDQAFVNAFARRNQRSAKPADQPSIAAQEPTPLSKSWIDTDAGEVMRADTPAESVVPQPLADASAPVANPSQPAPSTTQNSAQQHLHTAYVFADPNNQTNRHDAAATVASDTHARIKPDVIDLRVDQAVPNDRATIKLHTKESPEPIQPIWEVDAFDIPQSVEQLFFEEKMFKLVARRIQDAVTDGLQSVMVTSSQAGEGRSTVAIGMAMAAAATGLRVALIDGDTQDPTLADDMRLDVDFGWVDTLRGGLPLSQIAVLSVEDGLTLIPLMPPQRQQATASATEIQVLIESMGDQFDLVVIDAPASDQPSIEQFAKLVDSAIIARDASRTDIDTINELSYRLQSAGVQGVGIVENFA